MGTYNDISNTYLQTLALLLQCIAISGLVLHYNGQTTQSAADSLARTMCTRILQHVNSLLHSQQVITANIENLYN